MAPKKRKNKGKESVPQKVPTSEHQPQITMKPVEFLPKPLLFEILNLWVPVSSLIKISTVCRFFKELRTEVAVKTLQLNNYINEGLKSLYFLEDVLSIDHCIALNITHHLSKGEGQYIFWGDDAELISFNELEDFFSPDKFRFLCLSGNSEFILDSDEAMAANPSPILRDPRGRFSHECYEKEQLEILASRDKIIDFTALTLEDIHSDVCIKCGSKNEVFFTADIKTAHGNLCAECLDKTILTRFKFQLKHYQACFFTSENVLTSYAISNELKNTNGTRYGLFFSNGAQHSAFGLEFWACPNLVGFDDSGLWATGKEEPVPPNAWKIVFENGFRGP